MLLSSWRTKFKKFIDSRVRVDNWFLQRPESYNEIVGFLPPLRDIDYKQTDNQQVVLTATQDFIVSQRLPSELAFNDLPLDIIEGYYNTLAIAFLANFEDIDPDILALRFNQVEQPISIAEVAEDANDWVVDIKWSLRVEVYVLPEFGSIYSPFELKSIEAHVWRSDITEDLTDGEAALHYKRIDFTQIWDFNKPVTTPEN